MVGGWMSFAGIDGKAKYHGSFLEAALPVTCLPYDDRQERLEGVIPTVTQPDHPIMQGLPATWPFFLGYNRVVPKEQATTLLWLEQDPLSVWQYGEGRGHLYLRLRTTLGAGGMA